MEQFTAVGAAIALVYTAAGLVRRASANAWRDVVMQVVVWIIGVLVAILLAASDFANGLVIGGLDLGNANVASVALVGLAIGSMAMVVKDTFKSIDQNQSAAEPKLGG